MSIIATSGNINGTVCATLIQQWGNSINLSKTNCSSENFISSDDLFNDKQFTHIFFNNVSEMSYMFLNITMKYIKQKIILL